MKKFWLAVLPFFFALNSMAQVTLDHTYNYSSYVVELESVGYKYFLMDVPLGQCRIYNMDHSLFKTINCNPPTNFYLSDIKYISETLFDTDAGIELLCTYSRYVESGTTYYYEFVSQIINEDGSIVLTIDKSQYNYVIPIGNDSYKLFSYCFNYSVLPEQVWTNIYNIPGKPIHVSTPAVEMSKDKVSLMAYPNPAQHQVKLAYELPEGISRANLMLVDNQGRLIEKFVVDTHISYLDIDVSKYAKGLYYYYIEYGNHRSSAIKLVVN